MQYGNDDDDDDDDDNEDDDKDDNTNDEKYVPKNICVTFQNGQWHSTDYPEG